MAIQDKNIIITPNIGQTADPKIVFSGADAATAAQNITLQVYPTDSGTLSFEGSAGQLFSITNNLSGTIFSVNDISGIPSIEVMDTGLIKLSEYSGNVVLGSEPDDGIHKLQINGSMAISGSILEGVYTITDGAAFELDPSNGTMQVVTLGANRTPKATNFLSGESVTLMVLDGSTYSITWTDTTFGPAGVKWAGGVVPILSVDQYTILEFWKISTQVYGAFGGYI